MKHIPIKNTEIFAIIDDEDYDRVNSLVWYIAPNNRVVSELINGKRILLSRFILNVTDLSLDVDHKFHSLLDHRKSELRICTMSQNHLNSLKQKNVSSKYKGVYWSKHKNKWHAQVRYQKKNYHLGYFNNEEDAAKAVNEFYRLHDPEFRIFNNV